MPRVLGVCASFLLLAGVLTACGSDPRDDAPVLEVAWSADLDDVWSDAGGLHVTDGELWIVRSPALDRLTAVRLDDGSVAWQLRVPDVCGLSEVNEAGLLAVQSGPGCGSVGVVDVASGEQTWSATVRRPAEGYPTPEGIPVGVTERTVTVAARCGIERWSVTDGAFLGRLAVEDVPQDRAAWACRGQAATGALALVAGPSGLRGYDADTGAERWSLPGGGAAVQGVYSVDPLVVDLDIDGLRAVRELDPATGVPGPVLGRTLPTIGRGPDVADPVGDTVVGVYHRPAGPLDATYASAVRGWDAGTGEEAWLRDAGGDDYLGSDARGTDLGRSIHRDGDSGYGYWVLRREPGRDDFRTVGWIEDQVLDAVRVGDLLLTGSDFTGTTTAYRLPAKTVGVGAPRSRDRDDVGEPADGDLQPGPRVDPCAAVSPSTLEALGFTRRAELPAPLDCRWTEGQRQLAVRVAVSRPSEDRTAREAAREEMSRLRGATAYDDVDLGDDAGAVTVRALGVAATDYLPGRAVSDVRLVLHWRNVVVEASYVEPAGGEFDDQQRLPRASFRAEEALRTAALEALAATGATDVPGAGDDVPAADGPVLSVPDVCAVLRRQVGGLLPGARGRALAAPGEDRLGGCRWHAPGERSFVQVLASATGPDVLTGLSAVETALASYDASTGGPGAGAVRGPGWDEAAAYDGSGGFRSLQRFTVRVGNLVAVVQVHLDDPDRRLADDAARGLARTLTDAVPATP